MEWTLVSLKFMSCISPLAREVKDFLDPQMRTGNPSLGFSPKFWTENPLRSEKGIIKALFKFDFLPQLNVQVPFIIHVDVSAVGWHWVQLTNDFLTILPLHFILDWTSSSSVFVNISNAFHTVSQLHFILDHSCISYWIELQVKSICQHLDSS